ncbi:hypothetical protein B0H19DRAFT_1081375 [Mycena capillaripes]|nr:hypothetical protein B0H19DRAFT_1081375 [Mycena capillaripes]
MSGMPKLGNHPCDCTFIRLVRSSFSRFPKPLNLVAAQNYSHRPNIPLPAPAMAAAPEVLEGVHAIFVTSLLRLSSLNLWIFVTMMGTCECSSHWLVFGKVWSLAEVTTFHRFPSKSRRSAKICELKRSNEVTKVGTTLREAWGTLLKPGLTQILAWEEPITVEEYIQMYNVMYNLFCGARRTNGNELNSLLNQFFEEHTKGISMWDQFSAALRVVERVWTFFNRDYVLPMRQAGHIEILPVKNMALIYWKTNVFEPLYPRLRAAIEDDFAHLDASRKLFASENLTAGR